MWSMTLSMGSILFAVQHLGCRLVVVLGHSRCSVVASAVQTWARQQKLDKGGAVCQKLGRRSATNTEQWKWWKSHLSAKIRGVAFFDSHFGAQLSSGEKQRLLGSRMQYLQNSACLPFQYSKENGGIFPAWIAIELICVLAWQRVMLQCCILR